MFFQAHLKRTVLGLIAAAALIVSVAAPAFATDVTQVINGGGALSASVADASMTAITYSNTQGSTTGLLSLAVSDPRGSALGWNVTLASTDFVYGGTSSIGLDIPNTGFAISSTGTPVYVSGQAINAHGPLAVSAGAASLNVARKTITAGDGSGSGSYTQSLPLSLVIPAYSQSGSYVAVVTVSITTGP